TEQRPANRGECEPGHLGEHVDRCARAPTLLSLSGCRGHRRDIALDAPLVERGLEKPALSRMELTLVGEQPFAEEDFDLFQGSALADVAAAPDEHLVDEIGMVE